jgi:hypothetical protein
VNPGDNEEEQRPEDYDRWRNGLNRSFYGREDFQNHPEWSRLSGPLGEEGEANRINRWHGPMHPSDENSAAQQDPEVPAEPEPRPEAAPLLFPPEAEHSKDGLTALMKRAELMESEALKDASGLLVKVGAGFGGTLAVVGAALGARDTLLFRALSENRWIFVFLVVEVGLLAASLWYFYQAYAPLKAKIGPNLIDNAEMNEYLASGEYMVRARIFLVIQESVKLNTFAISRRSTYISRGLLCLIGLVLSVFVHAGASGIIKSETEFREKRAPRAPSLSPGTLQDGGPSMADSNNSKTPSTPASTQAPSVPFTPKPSGMVEFTKGGDAGIVRKK